MDEYTPNPWGLTPEQQAANRDYWRAHNARCRELNRSKYGDSAQLVINVRLGKFQYRVPLPVYRRRAAA